MRYSKHSDFRGPLLGTLIDPRIKARKIYNAIIDREPGLIGSCTDAADVTALVRPPRASCRNY
jgi:hypothetical protein